jgi:glycosyltransferase involved in cell wall biosynthesis
MKTAICYDRVNKWGGAERVLMALNEMFPEAPLFTSVYDKKRAGWAKVFPEVKTSFLQNLPFAKSNHEYLAPFMPLAFETVSLGAFEGYDLIISTTSEAAKGVITKPGTKHICYCHTPTRYLWVAPEDYFKNPLFRFLSKPAVNYLKKWDVTASSRPDCFVANSNVVKSRIKKYYDKDSVVIHPPVDIARFSSPSIHPQKRDRYYLIVSRLVAYKKIDTAIEAFNRLGKKLVIAGCGKEMERLKKMANNNIEFLGFVDENKLLDLYAGAGAFIYPQEEDFGITAVEAQAAGVPVIALNRGGVRDTVLNNKTGVFFDEQTADSLIEAVERFENLNFSKTEIRKNAKRFSKEVFKKKMQELIGNIIEDPYVSN